MPTPSRRVWRHAAVLLLYAALGLALTYPLITRFSTHVPGDGIDDPALAWNLWWLKTSLVDRQLNPFLSQWMFYPIGINLAFYTLTILNGLLSIPLQVAWGLVPASNLILLSSFVLSGYGAFLLSLEVLTSAAGSQQSRVRPQSAAGQAPAGVQRASLVLHCSAFLAGLLYAYSSSKLFYAALGQANIASSQWIPFAILYILRSGRPGARLREPLLAGLFILLQAYAELTYASFLVIFIGFYALYCLIEVLAQRARTRATARTSADLGRLVRNLVVMGLVILIGLAPILAHMIPDMRAEGDFLVEGRGFADIFSADLAGYALPTQLHPLLGDIVRTASHDSQLQPDGSQWQVNKGQHLTLGWVGAALALAGLWAGRRRSLTWFWALSVLTFFLLTLGPSLRIAGNDLGIPLPFRLLQEMPFFKGNRYPSRFSVMLLVSVAPLVAMGAHALLLRLAARWQTKHDGAGVARRVSATAVLLAGLLVFENLSAPLPTADMRVPGIYDRIKAEPGEFAVLDLPVGWRNGFSVFGKQDIIIMSEQWWQTRHGHPILGGNTSRNPEQKFRYFLEAPLIGPLAVLANATDANPHIQAQMADGLAALRSGDPSLGGNGLLLRAAQEARQALSDLNVRFVVVHRETVPPEFVTFVETFLPIERVAEEGQHVLYRVDLAAPSSSVIVQPATDPLILGEGWSGPAQPDSDGTPPTRWAERQQVRLLLPPVQPGTHRLTVRAAAAGPGQLLALTVNGHETAAQPLPEGWTDVAFDVPAGVLRESSNEVRLRFVKTFPVDRVLAAPPGTASEQASASLLVESASLEAGDYAHIWLNGRDLSPNERGYNLAIVDTGTWQPVAAAAFDTHLDPGASAELLAFLGRLDDHSALAVAVKDTASDQLSAEAAQALADLGLTDLRGRFRWGQAAIVLPSDAATGERTVIEQVSGLEPVHAVVGPGWREPYVAAVVESVRVEP
jgi:hypothetical protein